VGQHQGTGPRIGHPKHMKKQTDPPQRICRITWIPSQRCQIPQFAHPLPMNSATRLSIFSAFLLLLPSCGDPPPPLTNSTIGPGIGPFDARGTYREDWADDPSKWRRPSGQLASNDRPPPNANPLPPSANSTSRPISNPTVKPVSQPDVMLPSRPAPRPDATTTASRPDATRASRPVPKPVAKPSTKRHTVKRGDTLSGIASRYGASVTAIRRANGISGNLIHPGQRLVIPSR